MELKPVTKLDKRNKTTWKEFDYDLMLANCEATVIFSTYGQIGAVWKPDSGLTVFKT